MNKHLSENTEPMSTAKAISFLGLLYLLIGGSAVWRVREICLLGRAQCGYYDLLDTVFSSRLITTACIVFIGLLIFITVHMVAKFRDNTLGIAVDPPGRRFCVNGYLIALIVFPLYWVGSLVVLISAASDLEPYHEDKVTSFFWMAFWATQGSLMLLMIMWHLNDYFVKPASRLLMFLLFGATVGSISWIVRSVLVPA